MGSNPSKSQNLQELFPSYHFQYQLTTHPSNQYQFIFVSQGDNLFIIKESESAFPKLHHPNIMNLIESKQLEGMHYGLYEWMPNSIEKVYECYSEMLTRETAIEFMMSCVLGYEYVWKMDRKEWLDIRSDNIRANLKNNKIIIKVVQPSLTQLPQNHHYKNRISDLGFVIRKILIGNHSYHHCYLENKYGKDIQQFVNLLIQTEVTNNQQWDKIAVALNNLLKPKMTPPLKENNSLLNISNISAHTAHTLKNHTPYQQRKASFSPTHNFSQFTIPKNPRTPPKKTNNTQFRLTPNENSQYSVQSPKYKTPKKIQFPQIVTSSRYIGSPTRTPVKFIPQNPSSNKILLLQKSIPISPMFVPSIKDQPTPNWQIGVPTRTYTQKMKEDQNFIYSDIYEERPRKKKKTIPLLENLLRSKNKQKQTLNEEEVCWELSDDDEVEDGVYEGSYHSSHPEIKHGHGRFIFKSGKIYIGDFNWDKIDGWGKLFYPSGRLAYDGHWKEGKFDGYGKLFNEKPLQLQICDYRDFNSVQFSGEEGFWKIYEGFMKNNKKEGEGTWVLENGEKYEGQFHNNMVDGYGRFYGMKETVEGRWKENLLVEVFRTNK